MRLGTYQDEEEREPSVERYQQEECTLYCVYSIQRTLTRFFSLSLPLFIFLSLSEKRRC
jgi:hypothetical protein